MAAPSCARSASEIVGDVREPLLIVFGTVGFVLLIACGNVANLLLVRAEGRRQENAVRVALGSGRFRLVRQMLVESAVLALMGGAAGVLLAYAGIRALVSIAPAGIPRLDEIGINGAALAFTALVSVLTGLLFGVLPAVRASSTRVDGRAARRQPQCDGRPRQASHAQCARDDTGRARVRARHRLRADGPQLPGATVGRPRVLRRWRTDVRGAAAADEVCGRRGRGAVLRPTHRAARSHPRRDPGGRRRRAAADGQWQQLCGGDRGVPSGRGRPSARLRGSPHDARVLRGDEHPRGRGTARSRRTTTIGVLPSVIISNSVKAQYWPQTSALGKRIDIGKLSARVVGVVGDVHDTGLDVAAEQFLYLPMLDAAGGGVRAMTMTVRTAVEPLSMVSAIRGAIAELDGDLPMAKVQSMERVLGDSMSRTSFTMSVLVIAALIALFLGAVGIYGVLSYVVSLRTQEIGTRLALGASPGTVLRMVLSQGMRLAGVGALIGLVAALALGRVMVAHLYGVSPVDPVTLVATSAIFLAVAVLASLLPAARAAGTAPVDALRAS